MEMPNILESELSNNNDKTTDITEEVPMEIVKDDEATSVPRLRIKDFDDEGENVVRLTVEEAHNYIISKALDYVKDPEVNPVLNLKQDIETLNDTVQKQEKDIATITRWFGNLFRDQDKFLRHAGVLPKIETRTVGVSVNLPWLTEDEEVFIKSEGIQTGFKDFLQQSGELSFKVPKEASNQSPIECIDLTDDAPDSDSANSASATTKSANLTDMPSTFSAISSSATSRAPAEIKTTGEILQHPAPLPPVPSGMDESKIPPQPRLKIAVDKSGIILQWDLPPDAKDCKITGYEIFGYQEKNNMPVSSALWKKIGRVDPLALPMSCTLTQFMEGFKYHFSIRALSNDDNSGPFSDPASVTFVSS